MRQKAQALAAQLHAGQTRKDGVTPYITHTVGVADLVAYWGGDENQQAIAELHDVIEDCYEGHLKLTGFKVIRQQFGDEIALGVLDLTNTSKQDAPELNRAARKALDTKRLENIPKKTKLVKLCDIKYNVNDLEGFDYGFALKFLAEKRLQAQAVCEGNKYLYLEILQDIERQELRFHAERRAASA